MKNNFTKPAIYINRQVLDYFNQSEIIIKTPDAKLINNISDLKDSILTLAVTNSSIEAVNLKNEHDCSICYVNNHTNDCIDFTPTYEITKEKVPQQLQKILTRHQKCLKKTDL